MTIAALTLISGLAITFFRLSIATNSTGNGTVCVPGNVWISDQIQYTCYTIAGDKETTTGYKPTGCVCGNNTVIKPQAMYQDRNFQYLCNKVDDNTIIYSIVACFTPSGTKMNVGDTVNQDGGMYFCSSLANGGVTRTFTKETQCSYNSQKYALNAIWVDGNVKLTCYQTNGQFAVKAQYCIASNGTVIQVGDDGKVNGVYVTCVRDSKDQTKATLKNLTVSTCKDNSETVHNIDEKWEDAQMQYQCLLSGLATVVKPIQCVMTVAGKKFYIGLNGATKGSDGNWYWCKGMGNNTYRAILLPPEKCICISSKNVTYTINQSFNDGLIQYKCSFSNGAAVLSQTACLIQPPIANITMLNKNQIKETAPGTAIKCSPDKNGNLVIQPLSSQEYNTWKGANNVSASGYQGSGAEGSQCKDGFQLINGTCTDIDECNDNKANCSPEERCVNTAPGFRCICIVGYQRQNGSSKCQDIDECKANVTYCKDDEICQNTVGSYLCKCKSGFVQLNGSCISHSTTMSQSTTAAHTTRPNTTAAHFNTTIVHPKTTEVLPKTTAVAHTMEHLTTAAATTERRSTITRINECSENIAKCSHNENCINTPSGYKCVCKTGFQKNPVSEECEDINECEKRDICEENELCMNTIGSYQCRCRNGAAKSNGKCLNLPTTTMLQRTTTGTMYTSSDSMCQCQSFTLH